MKTTSNKKKNYYEILNVEPTANEKEIKKAFKVLAMKHHPDKGGDQDKFKEINEAYAVLSDANKREKYDRFGTVDMEDIQMPDVHNIFQNLFGDGFFSGQGGGSPFFSSFHSSNNDPFSGPKKGENRHKDIYITLEEVMRGEKIPYKLERKIYKNKKTCHDCQGSGQKIEKMSIGLGIMTQHIATCSLCKGRGNLYDETNCKSEEEIITLDIPPGIQQGQQILLRGKGDTFEGLQNGNIILTVHYEKHPSFHVSNTNPLDVVYTCPITIAQFYCGFDIQFKHLNGNLIHVYSTEILSLYLSSKQSLQKIIPNLGFSFERHQGDLIIDFEIIMSLPKSIMKQLETLCKKEEEEENKSFYYDYEYNIKNLKWAQESSNNE